MVLDAVDIDTDSVTLFAIDLSLCLNVCMDIDSDINLVNTLAGVTAVSYTHLTLPTTPYV